MNTIPTDDLKDRYRRWMKSLAVFVEEAGGMTLRQYQIAPGEAIIESVRQNLGLTFVLILPRQSGKDELLSHIQVYLMRLLSYKERSIVVVNPTYKPQTQNAIDRLQKRLNANILTAGRWHKRSDYIRYIGGCRTVFLSGESTASVVGATADLLLIINEAQDIAPATYDKRFAPMAASRNATRVICGTVWTSQTLLARELRAARFAEKADGIRRVFISTATDVGKENAKYRAYVRGEVARQGRQHPYVKTQYFCEEVDALAGMFNPGRRALMLGDQPPQDAPAPGTPYAFLIDVAGQDEARLDPDNSEADLMNPGRDSTTLSIASIDLSSLETLQAPTYRIMKRFAWTGLSHLTILGHVKALVKTWKPQHIVVDATGVGEGLYAMLYKAFRTRVKSVKFTQMKKSDIGWKFLSIIGTGRFKDCDPTDAVSLQYDGCLSEMLPGPNKILRWGVPEGTHSPDGELVHDDHVLADSLVTELEDLDWHISTDSLQIEGFDPLSREVKL